MRPPFVALVTGPTPGHLDTPLNLLGARAIFVPLDTISATLRRGRDSVLESEVIIIDASDRNPATLALAMNLVDELRALPYSAKMPTGVSWNAVPIVIVGFDHAIIHLVGVATPFSGMSARHSDVHTCSLIEGWERCYRVIADAAIDFSIRVAEDMSDIGWRIISANGRRYREIAPNPLRGPMRSTALYDPAGDLWFTKLTRSDKRMYRVVAADRSAIAYDAEMLHDLNKKRDLPEGVFQRFLEERPHYLDATRHEVISQVDLYRADGKRLRLDFAVVPVPEFATTLPRLIEIKTPDMPLISGRDPHRAIWAYPAAKAISQVRDYKVTAQAMGSMNLPRRYFTLNPSNATLHVIAGLSRENNIIALDRARSYEADVEFLGYDDVETRLAKRHSVPASEVAPTPVPVKPPKPLGVGRREPRTRTRKSA